MESSLLTHAAVENLCVCGDSSKSHVVCLLIPTQNFLDSLAIKVSKSHFGRYHSIRATCIVKF